MRVKLEDQEMRKWVDVICVLGGVGTFLIGKEFDARFLIVRGSEFPIKNNVGTIPLIGEEMYFLIKDHVILTILALHSHLILLFLALVLFFQQSAG